MVNGLMKMVGGGEGEVNLYKTVSPEPVEGRSKVYTVVYA